MVNHEARFPERERRWRQTSRTYLFIALGGMIGALARHAVTAGTVSTLGHQALGTFIANVSGAFLLGYVSTVSADKFAISLDLRRFIGIGVLGSYTTFSILSYQTLEMLENGQIIAASANASGSLIVGLAAVAAGVKVART
jgi:fluoride exporter